MTATAKLIGGFEARTRLPLPIFLQSVPAGFPSPADDHIDKKLDLNEELIKHPQATFFFHVQGESMIGAGISEGDILIVDRAEEPTHGRIVIAVLDGEFTIKRLHRNNGTIQLLPENPKFKAIELKNDSELQIWGVVTRIIKAC